MTKDKIVKTLEEISKDMEYDAKTFDGKPFTGRTVGEYFGNHGAAIATIADIVKFILKELTEEGSK